MDLNTAYLSGSSLWQITDDEDLLWRCEWANHLTDLEDKFLGETGFVILIVREFAKR